MMFGSRRRNKQKVERVIVKVQVSLFTSEPGGSQYLVYDKNKTFMYQAPVTEDVIAMMGEEPKRYFWASVTRLGNQRCNLEIEDEVEPQEW
jgi:hypothetical protein